MSDRNAASAEGRGADATVAPVTPGRATAHVTIPSNRLDHDGVREAQRALRAADGVQWAHVSADTEMAYVRFDPQRTTAAAFRAAVRRVERSHARHGGQNSVL